MKKIIVFVMILFVILFVILFAGCNKVNIVKTNYKNVEGVVISKNYIPKGKCVNYLYDNGNYVPIDSFENSKYNVVISYENFQYKVDNKDIYNSVKVGDKKQMRLANTYFENDNTVVGHQLLP